MQLHAEQAPELPAWEPVFVWPGKRAVPPGLERTVCAAAFENLAKIFPLFSVEKKNLPNTI